MCSGQARPSQTSSAPASLSPNGRRYPWPPIPARVRFATSRPNRSSSRVPAGPIFLLPFPLCSRNRGSPGSRCRIRRRPLRGPRNRPDTSSCRRLGPLVGVLPSGRASVPAVRASAPVVLVGVQAVLGGLAQAVLVVGPAVPGPGAPAAVPGWVAVVLRCQLRGPSTLTPRKGLDVEFISRARRRMTSAAAPNAKPRLWS